MAQATQVVPRPLTNRGRYWLEHLKQWQASDTTQIQYCKDRDLSLSAFRWWWRRLRDSKDVRLGRRPFADQAAAPFAEIPMQLVCGSETGYTYEITLPNQRQLRLKKGFDAKAVSTLLPLLEQSC